LYDYLKSKNYKDTEIEKAGLIKKSDKENNHESKNYYDRFRDRIMFPISDSAGRIVAFSGRALSINDKTAKYINSPETLLYNKSDILYGYDKAKQHIKKAKTCILVEGQMDLILAHQAGFPYTVAVSGTSFTGGHLNRIRRLTKNLVIAFDRDRAGIVSMSKTARMALGMGMNVNTALLPEGKDPADVIVSNRNEWGRIIKDSKHTIEVFLEQINKKSTDQRQFWLQVEKHVLPIVASMSDKIDQAHFISRINKITQIPEKAIREELKKIEVNIEKEENKVAANANRSRSTIPRKEVITKTLKAIVLWQSSSKTPKINVEKLKDRIDILFGTKQNYNLEVTDLQELIFRIEKVYTDESKLKDDIEELLLGLERELIYKTLGDITRDIRISEESGNKIQTKKLMERHQKLSKRLDDIKQKN